MGNRIKLGMIGGVKVKVHREIQGEIKTATIKKDADQWSTALSVLKAIRAKDGPGD
jgi:putative transposase